jgi:hypothetical protein
MPEPGIDQASGLRRLFGAAPWRRPVCFLAPEPGLARAGVLSLADGLEGYGIAATVDGRDGAHDVRALRLFDDPDRLAGSAGASGVDLVAQGTVDPAGITELYGRIKRTASHHRIDRLAIVLVGPLETPIAERCRANLASALERFLGVRVEAWASLGAGRVLRRAARAGASVQALDREGEESREFDRLAGHLAGSLASRMEPATH